VSRPGIDGGTEPVGGWTSASTEKYPDELRERAIRMILELGADPATARGALARVGRPLGINKDTLRNWVEREEIDTGLKPGVTTAEQQRINGLEGEVRELGRANEILKTASAFFAAELDRPHRR
jgi:transposase